MKTTRLMLVLAAALAVGLGTLAPTPASADGGYRKPHYPAAGYKRYAPAHYGGYYRTGGYRGYYGGGGTRYNFVFGLGPGFFGYPYYAPYYGYGPYAYPYPAYGYPAYAYPPAVMTAPSSPPTYIERGAPDQTAEPAQSAYWYYCRDANGYYPYVKQCPGGWERVAPQPPPAR